jgi:hypothetical protein
MKGNLTAKIRILPALAVLALWQGSSTARADIPAGDTIIAEFSNVVVSGSVANDPATGDLTYMNNTGTAVYNIGSDVGTNNELSWGSGGTSELIFFGTGASVPTDQTSPFLIGSLFFFNGESALDSLIFGATLTFYDQSGSDPSDLTSLGSDNVVITTTSNQYASVTNPTTAELQTDADYVNICGSLTTICGQSLEAYEFGEDPSGGYISVNLYGTVAGDPQLTVTGASITGGTGIIGSEAPLAATPEPSQLALLSAALLVCIGLTRRRTQRRRA